MSRNAWSGDRVQQAQAAPSLGGSAWHRCPCRLKKEKEKVSFILEGSFAAFRSSLPNGVAAGSLVLDLKDTNTSLPATLPHPAQGETRV